VTCRLTFGCAAPVRSCAPRGCPRSLNSPRLNEGGIAAFYDRNYYVFSERHADAFKRVVDLYQFTIKTPLAFAPPRQVMEVGRARGHTLALMRGPGWDTMGVELSPFAAASAQQIFDLTVHQGTLEDFVAKWPGVSYPVVFSCADDGTRGQTCRKASASNSMTTMLRSRSRNGLPLFMVVRCARPILAYTEGPL
jgi:hypothetical protein